MCIRDRVPAAPLPIQLSAVAWESSGRWPKSLGPCACVGDLEEAPGSWLQICPALAIAAIWGVNHQMDDFLSASASLLLCLSNKINKSLFKKIYLFYLKASYTEREGSRERSSI